MKKEDLDAEGKPKSNNTGKSKLTAELMMFKLQSPSLAQAHHRPVSPPVFFFLKITSTRSISLQETPRAPFLVSIPQISLAVVLSCCGGKPGHCRDYLSSGVTPRALPGERVSRGSAHTPIVSFFQSLSVQKKCWSGLPENEFRAAAAEAAQEKIASSSSVAHGVKAVGRGEIASLTRAAS